jgi:DNA-binding transcriptional MerR regulator
MSMVSGSDARGALVAKSAAAFRTISEVSSELEVPQHVLRFWETKFPQIKPLKRGGGRRYYRPDDVVLLRRIQTLLYKEGYTIRGVQRLLKETRSATSAASPVKLPPPERQTPPLAPVMADPEPAASLFDESEPADPQIELRAILQELVEIRTLLKK